MAYRLARAAVAGLAAGLAVGAACARAPATPLAGRWELTLVGDARAAPPGGWRGPIRATLDLARLDSAPLTLRYIGTSDLRDLPDYRGVLSGKAEAISDAGGRVELWLAEYVDPATVDPGYADNHFHLALTGRARGDTVAGEWVFPWPLEGGGPRYRGSFRLVRRQAAGPGRQPPNIGLKLTAPSASVRDARTDRVPSTI